MDQELMNMINNMKSIAEQMTQMLSGDAGAGAPQQQQAPAGAEGDESSFMKKLLKVLKEEDDVEGEEDEFATGEKPMLTKSRSIKKDDMDDEATNASDDAEEILDAGIPEATEENIEEVAKSIMKMLRKSKGKSVQKSNSEQPIMILADEVKELKKSLSNILEGLGIADDVRKQYVQKPEQRQIRSENSIQKSLDEIRTLVTGDRIGSVEKENSGFDLHKSLTDDSGSILKAMLSVRNGK